MRCCSFSISKVIAMWIKIVRRLYWTSLTIEILDGVSPILSDNSHPCFQPFLTTWISFPDRPTNVLQDRFSALFKPCSHSQNPLHIPSYSYRSKPRKRMPICPWQKRPISDLLLFTVADQIRIKHIFQHPCPAPIVIFVLISTAIRYIGMTGLGGFNSSSVTAALWW